MLFSQEWIKNLPQNKSKAALTLFDYQNAFYSYWAPFNVENGFYTQNGEKKKAAGWKQFKRWEYDMERQINQVTGELPKKSGQQVYEEFLQSNPQSDAFQPANWTSLGTNSSTGGYAGIGRLNCIAYHPSNTNIYWVGAAAGGLWMTSNNAASWTCLTDNNGILAVSDIAIPTDYATSNTIYIATGDKDHWDNRSIGVLKSTNGGTTWNTTGITYTLSNGYMVNRLLMDPNNNQILLAATTTGVYKTINGGTTWNTQLTGTNFIDLEYKPGDFNTLYGSTTNGKIYLSTNAGGTWTQVYNDASALRIELAVSANQPTWVYAVAANSASGLYGIFQSTNSGSAFTQVFAGTTLNLLGWNSNGGDSGGQGWYDLSLAASPSNASTLLVGGVNTWRSTNGGTSWSIVSHWAGSGAQAVHADKHSLSFRTNGDLFECSDGGVYISTNNGTNWTDKTNGMVISQMYKLGISQTVSDETITGLQDNGTKLLSGGFWDDVKGGDGMECLIDYTTVNVQYGTYVNGQIDRTINHWLSAVQIQPSGAGNGAWVTPYIIDPGNSLTLYAGYADVWKTTNRGDSWTKISTMNTSSKIRSMAIAPSNTQTLYVADPSIIWKTTNGGTTWTNITGTLPVGSGSITYIAVKNDDPLTIWVTLGGYNATTVYQSVNGGTTWTNISTGLPLIPAYSIVQNKQSTPEVQLYAGTEVGVYFKKGTDNWIAFNTGLPNVKIGELEIYYAINPQSSKIRAATFGRGLWESLVYSSCTPVPVPTITGPASVCLGNNGTYSTETGMTGYIWIVSPGGTILSGSGTSQITVAWNVSGPQTVSINYTNSNLCTAPSPTVKNVSVNPLPVPSITGPATACSGATGVNFSTESGMTGYIWTISSGGTITGGSGTNQITVTWNASGAQTVSVNYTNSNSCTANSATVKPVTINALPVPTITGPATACIGTSGVIYSTEAGMTGYIWAISSGGTIAGGSSTNQINVTWNASGAQTVSVNYTNSNSCTATSATIKPVTINALPVPTITGLATACIGATGIVYATEAGMTGYIWTISSGGTITGGSGTNQITVTWNTAGAKTVSVNYTNSNSCTAASPTVKNVTVNPLPSATITPGGPTTFCAGNSVILTASLANSYLWNTGGTTQSITVTTGGNYYVTVTDGNGCSATSVSTAINVNPLPVANAGTDQTIGYGASANLTGSATSGSGSYSWHWEPASFLVNPNIQNPVTLSLTSSVQFTLTATDLATGCTGDDQVLVTITGGPLTVDVTATPGTSCPGSAVQLAAIPSGGTGNNSYSWSSNPAGFFATISNPIAYPVVSTTYTAVVNDGFSNITDSVFVTVLPLPGIPETPTGPDTVDLYTVVTSTYVTPPAASANSYLWELNPASAGTISGTGTTGTINWNPNFLGTAHIRVKSVNSCDESLWSNEKLTIAKNTVTGITENNFHINVIIYPNPAKDLLTIEFPDFTEKLLPVLEFYTVWGQSIKKITLREAKTQLDISNLPAAVYMIKMTIGNESRMIRFIKTRD